MTKSHGLERMYNENHANISWPIIYFFSDDFGLRRPVIQKTFSPKKDIPLS